METRRIGTLDVTLVGIGCNNFGRRIDGQQVTEVVDAALEAGINFFDTADVYGDSRSEELLGRAIAGRRDEVVIATKFGGDMGGGRKGAKPEYVHRAVEDSLRRLGTDHIDLYQLHFPDEDTPIGDTLDALNELVDAGKVREIGCSNFSADQLDWAQRAASDRDDKRFASVQNELSLLVRDVGQDELEAVMADHGVSFLPYFPLASGMLTGKYRQGEAPPEGTRFAESPKARDRYFSEENFAALEALRGFAEDRGHTVLDLAFAWLAAQPRVASVIAGARNPEQVRQNAAAVQWSLSEEELAEVDRLRPADKKE